MANTKKALKQILRILIADVALTAGAMGIGGGVVSAQSATPIASGIPAIPLSGTTSVVSDGRHVYAISVDKVYRYNAKTGAQQGDPITVDDSTDGGGRGLAIIGGTLWALAADHGDVTIIDLRSWTINRVITINNYPTYFSPSSIFSDGTHVWITLACIATPVPAGGLLELNQDGTFAHETLEASIFPTQRAPYDSYSDGKTVWVANLLSNSISVFDVRHMRRGFTTITLHSDSGSEGPTSMTSDGDSVWVVQVNGRGFTGSVYRFKLSTGELLATSPLINLPPQRSFYDGTYVWVTASSHGQSELLAFDPKTLSLKNSPLALGSGAAGIDIDEKNSVIWVADGEGIDRLTLPTAPATPTSVSATFLTHAAQISWTSSAVLSVFPPKFVATATPGNKTCRVQSGNFCTITGLSKSKNYSISVKAVNGVGSSPWSIPHSGRTLAANP